MEFRSFAVDPQITSLEVLQHILIRAFELNGYERSPAPLRVIHAVYLSDLRRLFCIQEA